MQGMTDHRSSTPSCPPRAWRRRRSAFVLTAVAATVVLLGLGMPTALAHDELVGTTPAVDASVPTAPASVELEFGEAIQPLGTDVLVTGPDGATVSTGDVEIRGTLAVQALAGELSAGTYDVQWRATSADGHPLSGAFAFTVERPAGSESPVPATDTAVAPEPDSTAEEESTEEEAAAADGPVGSSLPVGWLAAGALLVAAGGGLGARRLRTRR